MKQKTIAVDFDGVICENNYPNIGKAKVDIIRALKGEVIFNNAKLILWTCRHGKHLDEAVKFCRDNGLTFDAINDNLPEMINKYQNNSRKIVADEYWDDKAISDIYISKKVKRENRKSLLTAIGLLLLSVIIAVTSIIGIVAIFKSAISDYQNPNAVNQLDEIVCYDIPVINPMPKKYCNAKIIPGVSLPVNVQKYLIDICNERNLDISIVLAIIYQESRFVSDVISPTNDYGLMQINKCNHAWLSKKLGIKNFLDPIDNINAGTYMLSILANRYTDPNKILMAYNMGEGGASSLWKRGICETQYSSSILKKSAEYKNNIKGEINNGC